MTLTKPKPPQSATALMSKMGNLPPVVPVMPKQLPPGTVDVVNALFKELRAIFPAWKQAWPDDEALDAAKRSWIKGFIVAGINTLEQIRYGLQNCRQSGTDFAPSVGKFIKWCLPTPEMMGIPAHNVAFREALLNLHPSRANSRQWSHPAVRHAALQCEQYNLADLVSEKASKVFDRAYDITIRMLVNGQPLEAIATGIGHDSQKTELELAEEQAQQFQARLIDLQGIPSDGASARAQLMAKFGKRNAS
ncbi:MULTISPECIES: replication protein P [unclassified Pseudomonas]|uniref:replication protein P n=1 Tax=unclassified Pseudomonas TaxID=196821 RepID=UPI002B225C23|nr:MULTISPECIES: replication protein P [unclassified Pseudomonas]MEA9994563.1 replication protein P [Pseudomonas sp. AA4]MEB0085708.1 replication protein P [Pseudomonas sp. RTI1]MEB0125967.1 replication protein P [Pseudomonas sp. CCC1.2]MEB0152771.1 replication protein P [Pseudomonas sp. CCC4.3]MEB0221276.1 replication protein P [Pseudomonas sp. AB12(2023)]